MKKFLLIICLLLITGCGSQERKVVTEYGDLAKELIGYGDKKVKVYVFAKEDCEICASANEYFNNLAEDEGYKDMFDYIYISLYDYNWNPSDLGLEQLMLDMATYFQDEFDGTPYIVVGEKGFNGYTVAWQELFKKEIKRCYEAETCNDPLLQLLNGELED